MILCLNMRRRRPICRREHFGNKKIAFLFLIYNGINNEKVWRTFFKHAPENQYNIFIHYKNYIKSEYFDKYKLNNNIETSWGDTSIILAQNLLLKEALKDPEMEHFIFLSNSCIPFKKFDHLYRKLDTSFSYFNMYDKEESFPRCNPSLDMIDKKFIQKSHQWCILNRKHAQILVDDIDIYIDWFDYQHTVPDEHSYITYIFSLKFDNELKMTENQSENATTFTNWKEHEYGCHPKTYESISDSEIEKLWKAPCFFGRKFNKNFIGTNKLIKLLN